MEVNKKKICKRLFERIINSSSLENLYAIFKEENIHIDNIFNPKTNELLELRFDERSLFDFSQLDLINLKLNISIKGDHYFEKIVISKNEGRNGGDRKIIFNGVSAKELDINKNGGIYLEISNSDYRDLFLSDSNARLFCLSNCKVSERLEIVTSKIDYIYIEQCRIEDFTITQSEVNFEGIVIKKN